MLALRGRYGFRVHVDGAYGGYFRLIPEALDEPARRAFAAIGEADSIVIDPHKHGLQPYGCGCVLFRDPAVGRFYKHDSPYTYFTSKQLHLGEISLECSRAGAAAVALWATQQLLPLTPGGEFARGLAHGTGCGLGAAPTDCVKTRRFQTPAAGAPELDIVVWKMNAKTRATGLGAGATCLLSLRRTGFASGPSRIAGGMVSAGGTRRKCGFETATVTCLRSVLMKPEHEAWLDRIWERLSSACKNLAGD